MNTDTILPRHLVKYETARKALFPNPDDRPTASTFRAWVNKGWLGKVKLPSGQVYFNLQEMQKQLETLFTIKPNLNR